MDVDQPWQVTVKKSNAVPDEGETCHKAYAKHIFALVNYSHDHFANRLTGINV